MGADSLATASQAVGSDLACTELGVEQLREAPCGGDPDSPLGVVLSGIIATARRLDHVHGQLVMLASSAARDLVRIAEGKDVDLPNTSGVLQANGLHIDILLARRSELYRQLTMLLGMHRSLSASTGSSSRSPVAAKPERAAAPRKRASGLTKTQEAALADIAAGKVHVRQASLRGSMSVSTTGATPISMATVGALTAKRMVTRSSSTSLFHGQLVEITAAGRAHLDGSASDSASRADAARQRPALHRLTPEQLGTRLAHGTVGASAPSGPGGDALGPEQRPSLTPAAHEPHH